MKWIKASDRLPEKRTDDLSKDKGIIFANTKRTAIMYVFLSITPNIPALLQNDLIGWEWLDESSSAEEAIGFAEWLSENDAEALGKDHWRFRQNTTHTTAQLFKIYKLSKK